MTLTQRGPAPDEIDEIERFCRRSGLLRLEFLASGVLARLSAGADELLGPLPPLPASAVPFIPAEESARWTAALQQARQGEPVELSCGWCRPGGERLELHWRLVGLHPGADAARAPGPGAVVEGWARLLARRSAATSGRRATPLPISDGPTPSAHSSLANQLALGLLTSSLFGVVVVGPSEQPLLVTPRVGLLIGQPAEALRRAPDWLALLVPEADRRLALRQRLAVELHERGAATAELELTTLPGAARRLRLTAIHLPAGSGAPTATLYLLGEAGEPAVATGDGPAAAVLEQWPWPVALVDGAGVLRLASGEFRRLFAGCGLQAAPGRALVELAGNDPTPLAAWLAALQQGPATMQAGPQLLRPGAAPDAPSAISLRGQRLLLPGGEPAVLLRAEPGGRPGPADRLRHLARLEALGTLAGGIAHDGGNLLGAILGYAVALRDDLPPGSPQLEDVLAILELADQARTLIRQLIHLGGGVEGESVASPNRVVEGTLRLVQRTFPTSIRLEPRLADELPEVPIRAAELEQCLVNLCLNAREAMAGGGILRLVTEAVEPAGGDPACGGPGPRWVALTVQDTGCGIDPAHQARLFEPFFTTKAEGTGLGLMMVARTVQRIGGTVTVQSEPGQGTTVRLLLPPAVAAAHPPAGGAAEPGTDCARPATVLVVSAAGTLRRAACRVLSPAGYSLLEAAAASDALELVRRQRAPVDVVLLDLALPAPGPARLLASLLGQEPALKVLVFAGDEEVVDELDWLARGAQALLPGPAAGARLLDGVRRALG